MTYLFIDTSKINEIRTALVVDSELNSYVEEIKHEYSEKLITAIDRVLHVANVNISQINKIFVIEGPGRFSALRTGISTANALAWQLNIPVISLPAVDISTEYWNNVQNQINLKIGNEKKFSNYIVPKYGKEPNISLKKRG